ncbi:MAG TPA: phosphate ABC transporter permease PstA [Cytophagaceae bacterium]|nr:phosphate ABC transporter permease PstA [Cytophagaceae bacterium]
MKVKKEKKKFKNRLNIGNFPKVKYYDYQDKIFKYFALACTLFGVAALGLLLYNVLSTGLGRIDWDFIIDGPSRRAASAGIFTALIGTLWIMVITAVIAFPIGISAAIYLEEYAKKSRLANILEINISNLAGVPSIIYGLLGLELFARMMNLGGSILTGSLTLALLILPIIIVSTREALKTVPYAIREASYALGATKWQTIWNQVLPASISGIFTGVILALSRAMGETAPLIVIGAFTFVSSAPTGIMDGFTVLPIQIFNWVSRPQHAFSVNAAAAIIVLLSITFIMNGIAVYLRHRWQKKIKW